jgi:hypothetical protein
VIPGVPSDNTTLLEVLDEMAAKGYSATMWVAADGKLRCEGCDAEIDPNTVPVHEYRRMEGASDPDDMLIVAAVECPPCGMKATIVLHYGPESSPEEMEVLRHLERAAPH